MCGAYTLGVAACPLGRCEVHLALLLGPLLVHIQMLSQVGCDEVQGCYTPLLPRPVRVHSFPPSSTIPIMGEVHTCISFRLWSVPPVGQPLLPVGNLMPTLVTYDGWPIAPQRVGHEHHSQHWLLHFYTPTCCGNGSLGSAQWLSRVPCSMQ